GDRRVRSTRRPAGFANDAATALVDRTPFDEGTSRRRSRAEAGDPNAAPELPRVRPVHTPTTRGTPPAPPPAGCRPASARPPLPTRSRRRAPGRRSGRGGPAAPPAGHAAGVRPVYPGPLPDPLITSLIIGTVGTDCRVARVGPTTRMALD